MEPEEEKKDELSGYINLTGSSIVSGTGTSDGIFSTMSSGTTFTTINYEDLLKAGMAMSGGSGFLKDAGGYMTPKDLAFFFESAADTEQANQLKEERENVILGIKALEQNVLFYEEKIRDMQEQLTAVEDQLDSLRPGSFTKGELKLESRPSRLVEKLELEIVRALKRGPKDLTEMIIMVHPNTFALVMKDIHSGLFSMDKSGSSFKYKGIKVVRSYDIDEDSFIVT